MLNGGVSTVEEGDESGADYIPYLDTKGPFMFFPP
jgi:hypothetical protein